MPVYEVALRRSSRKTVAAPAGASPVDGAKSQEQNQSKGISGEAKDDDEFKQSTTVEFSEPAQWVERMALTSTKSLPADLCADDDPKREEAFIHQALLSVSRGISLLEAGDVPWKRPLDYYAEMFKDDVQMKRIADAMEKSKARIEARAHRRAMKDQKKYGKEVQAEVLRQRAKYKREMGERINEWRRKRKGNDELHGILDDGNDGINGESGGRGVRRGHQIRGRNLRPGGGGGKRRPGKNARRRL
ncbi:putative Eukaryotic rRNA processing protein EBP2 [Trypanosoma vivax]|uniref:Putative rRNA processing protein n=1 Tax=Trypanosoma vivax (strain Y486) TaxID=1055687 RepID=G0U3R0_TRYVY|nr:putative rRNA processing protein [Trypanosoma vivax]KAH8613890.1 putative Eukaryotic rRNA processing protein EBP2 [Trypanosoma vivax]CCC50919.1 putative rRNA processing protein [Trypanosoma vivax Y486]